ncbi:MAG: M48 family metalloprotease [Sedimentisphaerales bacterium]|nr:M48 family metalloprotease [Sedimentisphaerales bacterium]
MNNIIDNIIKIFNETGRAFCDFSLTMFVQVSVLIILLLIIDILIRKRVRATFRYCIWMLVFIKLILPPALSLPTGIGNWFGEYFVVSSENIDKRAENNNQESSISAESFGTEFSPQQVRDLQNFSRTDTPRITETQKVSTAPQAIEPDITNANSMTWQGGIFLIWLIGVLVLSVLLIQRIFFVKSLIAQSEPAKNRLLETSQECSKQLGIRRSIGMKLSLNASSPAVCGLFKPVILIPANLLSKMSHDKFKAILIHELSHIKRADLWVNCVQTILQIIYFYNPLVWLANAIVRRIREQAVDEMVLVALGAEAKSYSNTLIDVAEMAFSRPALSLRLVGVVESKKALSERIKHILGRPIPKSAKLGIFGLFVVIIAAAILLPMAKRYKTTKLGGLYEKAKVSEDYKVKVGPTNFLADLVVRWDRSGEYIVRGPDGSKFGMEALPVPDYRKQAAWMDIAQVHISPGIEKYEAVELRVFDHEKREILNYEDYIGIGYNIQNSLVTIYSIGQLLPDEIDVWLRVIHKPDETKIIRVPAQENAVANLEDNTLKILEIKEGMYNRSSNLNGINWTKHHSEYDKTATSVAFQFSADNRSRRQYQICAVSKDGQRYVSTGAPHFISSANGRHHVIEIGFPKEKIDYFEISPFISRDTFYFDGIKLPKVSNLFASCPQVTFNINGKDGEFISNTLSPIELELYAYSNKRITGTSASADNWDNTFTVGQANEGTSGFAFKLNGMRTNNIQLAYYDRAGKRIDPNKSRGGSWSSGGTTTIKADSVNIPLEQINVVGIQISEDEIKLRPKFTATLPNGGTIELVGVCKKSQPNQPWYSPDGRQKLNSSDEIFSHLSGSSGIVSAADTQTYEFFIHCDLPSNKINKVVKNEWNFMSEQGIPGSFRSLFSSGQHYFTASRAFPETLDKINLTFYVSNGQWKTIAENDGNNEKEISITHRGQKQNVTLGKIEEKDGSLFIEVKHKIKEMAARVIVIDKFGNIREPHDNVLDWADSEGNILISKCRFDGMTKDRIDHYEIQIQPIDIVIFKDVSLKNDSYTNPAISVTSLNDEIPISARVEAAFMGPEFGQFAASLPGNVTVELVGLCKEPVEGAKWWKPDGSEMPEPSFEASTRTPPMGDIPTRYTVLAKAQGGEDISMKAKIYEGLGFLSKVAQDGTAFCFINYPDNSKPHHEDAFEKGPVEIGIAQGQWIIRQNVGEALHIPRSYLIGSSDQIVIQPPIADNAEPDMVTSIWANVTSHDYEFRLVCKLKDGSTRQSEQAYFQSANTIETGGLRNSAINTFQFVFDRLTFDQIADYELYYRKFEFVRFNNVAFKPGIKIDVQIDIQNKKDVEDTLVSEKDQAEAGESKGRIEWFYQNGKWIPVVSNQVQKEGQTGKTEWIFKDGQWFQVQNGSEKAAAAESTKEKESGNLQQVVGMVEPLHGLFTSAYEALFKENNPQKALSVLEAAEPQLDLVAAKIKGTSLETALSMVLQQGQLIISALKNNDIDKAKGLMEAINKAGPGLEEMLKSSIRDNSPEIKSLSTGSLSDADKANLFSMFLIIGTNCESIESELDKGNVETAKKYCETVEDVLPKMHALAKSTQFETIVTAGAKQFDIMYQALKEGDIEKTKTYLNIIMQMGNNSSQMFQKLLNPTSNDKPSSTKSDVTAGMVGTWFFDNPEGDDEQMAIFSDGRIVVLYSNGHKDQSHYENGVIELAEYGSAEFKLSLQENGAIVQYPVSQESGMAKIWRRIDTQPHTELIKSLTGNANGKTANKNQSGVAAEESENLNNNQNAKQKQEWGEMQNGLKCGLIKPAFKWNLENPPYLSLILSNESKKQFSFSTSSEINCEVEVDGTWYGWAKPMPEQFVKYSFDAKGSIKINLSDSWALPKDSKKLQYRPGDAEFWGNKLKIEPGKHIFRVKFRPLEWLEGYKNGEDGLFVISNSVEIEYLPKSKKTDEKTTQQTKDETNKQNKEQIILQADVVTIKRPLSVINDFLAKEFGLENSPYSELTETQIQKFKEWAVSMPGTNLASSPRTITYDGQSTKMSITTSTGYELQEKDVNSPDGHKLVNEVIKTGFELELVPELRKADNNIRLKIDIENSEPVESKSDANNPALLPAIHSQMISTKIAIPIGKYVLFQMSVIEGMMQADKQTFLLIKADVQYNIENEEH